MDHRFAWIKHDTDTRDHLRLIEAAMNRRFHQTKQQNPEGYLDQFEQQFVLHCLEVAKELEAELSFDKDYNPVISFVPGVTMLNTHPSNLGLKKEESHVPGCEEDQSAATRGTDQGAGTGEAASHGL